MKTNGRVIVPARIVTVLMAFVLLAVEMAPRAHQAAAKYPPQFPREGATKLFENDRIIVWEQVGGRKALMSTATFATPSYSASSLDG